MTGLIIRSKCMVGRRFIKIVGIAPLLINFIKNVMHAKKLPEINTHHSNNFSISSYKPKYLKQILELHEKELPSRLSYIKKLLLMIIGTRICYIAFSNETQRVLGFILFYFNRRDLIEKTIHLGAIAVHKDFQGKKIGSQLLKFSIENLLKSSVFTGISSIISLDNTASLKLHQHFGFNIHTTYFDTEKKKEYTYMMYHSGILTDKQKYRELCKNESSIPIFSRDWWLDAVIGENNWDVAITERGEEIVASFPYAIKRKLTFTVLSMPFLTQTLGIWIKYPERQKQKYVTKLSYEKEIFSALIDKLPSCDYFSQNFHWSITNWLPFYWKGFQQTTRYTYILEDLSSLDTIFVNFENSVKNHIKRTGKTFQVYTDDDIERFCRLNVMTYIRNNIKPLTLNFIKRLDDACKIRNCKKIFFVRDKNDEVLAAIYIVWDDRCAHYILSGRNPNIKNTGLTCLLLWEAIKFSSTVTKAFNFEGSMLEHIEGLFRHFGGTQKPYFEITKINSKILKLGKTVGIF